MVNPDGTITKVNMSPSIRREWIEMTEGKAAGVLADASPSIRREWIEILSHPP